jgi:hypothetical protein
VTTEGARTTREKIAVLADELRQMDPGEASEELAPLLEFAQILQGMGLDVVSALIPQSDAEADMLVDQLIAVLFQLRGDDLPPFDLERIIREAEALEAAE